MEAGHLTSEMVSLLHQPPLQLPVPEKGVLRVKLSLLWPLPLPLLPFCLALTSSHLLFLDS